MQAVDFRPVLMTVLSEHPACEIEQPLEHRLQALTSFSRARLMSLASVGNITFLGSTVVSTMIRRVSDGFMAPVFTATLTEVFTCNEVILTVLQWVTYQMVYILCPCKGLN